MNAAERLADPGFGNYMLNGLREITLPEPPSYRPQTLGWAILGSLVLLGIVIGSFQQYRHWRRNRYRRAALKQLAALEQHVQQSATRIDALQALSQLLKRTALAAYPREQVAQLYGENWLSFLDATYNGTGFTQGEGRLLSELAYRHPGAIAQLSDEEIDGLMDAAGRWIRGHASNK